MLNVGSLSDQDKIFILKSKKCFIIDNTTFDVVAFFPGENKKGLYKFWGDLTTLGP